MHDQSPRPRVSPRYQQQRRNILDCATPLLNQRGVTGMTLEDVAQGLGLKTTALLYYFRRKEELAAAIFRDSLDVLGAMVQTAAHEPDPPLRIARYIAQHFAHHAQALRGEIRPLAILAEIRALDEAARLPLIACYQQIFRGIRNLLGPIAHDQQRMVFTARAHVLSEALLWLPAWLPRYAINDFPNVQRRMENLLAHGLIAQGASWHPGDATAEPAGETQAGAYLRAATKLINDTGYRGASIDRIAAELNLTKGSFYHHIEAKDDLILQCCLASHRRMHAFQGDAGAPAWRQFTALLSNALAVQFAGDYPLLRTTALQAMPQPLRGQALDMFSRTALRISGLIVEAMANGAVRPVDPLIASQIVLSTINAAYDIRGWARRQPLPQAVAVYGATLMSGLLR